MSHAPDFVTQPRLYAPVDEREPLTVCPRHAFATRAVHAGHDTPVDDPPHAVFERCVAELEEGAAAVAFRSGGEALAAVLSLLEPGSHAVVCGALPCEAAAGIIGIHQGASRLELSFVDGSQLEAIGAAIRANTRMIWVETPSGPLLRLADLAAIVEIARVHHILCVADNTSATPFVQQPLAQGCDLVLHTSWNCLSGQAHEHGGIVAAAREGLLDALRARRDGPGAAALPDCRWVHQGLTTLPLRMKKQCENAQQLAHWLAARREVEQVHYPGAFSHPDYALARRQMKHFGGQLTVVMRDGAARVQRFVERCLLFAVAESPGGVASSLDWGAAAATSLLSHAAGLDAGQVEPGLVRLSVGIEDANDLIADLEHALR